MAQKIIAQGAEAKIILKNNLIIKDRIPKSYRIPELDNKIRKQRTKSEAKLLTKASKIINTPIPFFQPNSGFYQIKMPFINGKKLSEHLNKFPLKNQKEICKTIGKEIAKIHNSDIIHGDLTTSNMILVENKNVINKKSVNNKNNIKKRGDHKGLVVGDMKCSNKPIIYFIDFGLGFFNGKYEDKAVDIHLFKQALEAKHFKDWKKLYKEFEKGYGNSKDSKIIFERLKSVEKRGRYRH